MPNLIAPFTESDITYLEHCGITLEEANRQYNILQKGAFYPSVVKAASLEYGIMKVSEGEMSSYLEKWDSYRESDHASICKFVPASGAASRMFRDFFPLLDKQVSYTVDDLNAVQKQFFDHIGAFAFYKELNETCLRNEWTSISRLLNSGKYSTIIQNLLTSYGLDYAHLPKGLIPFHSYPNGEIRTAALEHLVEGALTCKGIDGKVQVHFTIPSDKREAFIGHIDRHKEYLEDELGVYFEVSYSEQSSSTDTLSLDNQGNLFRKADGTLLLRPGGHGALLKNLMELKSDIVLIKNIDNVSPDFLKGNTITYTKLLGGILLAVQEKVFSYLERIDSGRMSRSLTEEMLSFLREVFCIELSPNELVGDKETLERIFAKLNRPLRVCAMVHNEGEPGGGPFVVKEAGGTTSLQILESSQFSQDEASQEVFSSGAYFNPVLLACSLKGYSGNRFNLKDYVNSNLAFLTKKSYEGKEITSLEHPGLWNGSMDRWNTIFVEVPKSLFTPVKSVMDLLRPEHQTLYT